MIVSKFGGGATVSKTATKNMLKLMLNPDRQVLVLSAIGKGPNYAGDSKISDLLFGLANNIKNDQKTQDFINLIVNKYKLLCKWLNVKINITKIIKNYYKKYLITNDKNWLVSRGEYLTCYIVSKATNIKLIPAGRVVFFRDGKVDFVKTKSRLRMYLQRYKQIILPGFYGCDEHGKVFLLSRGGSDITGAIVARCLACELYENWTDTNGVYPINPELAKSRSIKKLNYSDLIVMTKYDAKVIHHDCAKLLQNTQVVLRVKNIYNLSQAGTTINSFYTGSPKYVVFCQMDKSVKVVYKTFDNKIVTTYIGKKNYKQNLIKIFNKNCSKK